MRYIECPKKYKPKEGEKSLFMAGGITSCPNWQPFLKSLLKQEKIAVLNPRREDFNTLIPGIELEQITWEFNHMKIATAISFWFPHETLCPITLYELGYWAASNRKIFVGCHRLYKRINDVKIQMGLCRPYLEVSQNIEGLAEQIQKWARG